MRKGNKQIQGVSAQPLESFMRDTIELDDGKSHSNALSEALSWRGIEDPKHNKGNT